MIRQVKKAMTPAFRSAIIGIIVTLVVVAVFTFGVWNRVLEEPGVESSCTDVNGASSISFESCFDLGTETIFLTARRNFYEDFEFDGMKITFFDGSQKEYDLDDIPPRGEFKVYYLTAVKNPRNAYIELSSSDVSSSDACTVPRRLFVKDCNLGGGPIGAPTTEVSDFVQVDLRTHLVELEQKELAWETQCSSVWDCGDWESCTDGLQKRSCVDVADCFIPTRVPNTVRYCSDTCIEDWDCTWSSCVDGKTIPSCTDRSACGTEYSKPSPVTCSFEDDCNPDISCGLWSECSVEYTIIDVQSQESLVELPGARQRLCIDKNACVGVVTERQTCSTGVDVYTQRFQKCGTEYVDVHNKLDDTLLARIDPGTEQDPGVNIRFDIAGENVYCDYCYNGVLDGDETNIDCGGSCGSCVGKSGPITLGETSFLGKLARWFSSIF